MNKRRLIILFITTIFYNSFIWAQKLDISISEIDRDSCLLHFRVNSSLVIKDYINNNSTLEKFNDIFSDTTYISQLNSISIFATTSPEGVLKNNELLAHERSNAIKGYLIWRYPYLKNITLNTQAYVCQWSELIPYIENDNIIPYKNLILKILKNQNNLTRATIEWRLRNIDNGLVWEYISKYYLPNLRSVWCVINTLKVTEQKKVISEVKELVAVNIPIDTLPVNPKTIPSSTEFNREKKEYFALKTNLLFDALLMPNIEIEVPIGNRFSISGEWMFPWWVGKNNDMALQILAGTLEGRYWFGDRSKKRKMTGWFAGFYAGGGLYDLQYKSEGYQGEFFIAAGLSGGYAHTINKKGNLRMEYSLGIGYLQTNYRHYIGMEDNKYLVWQNDGKYSWFGPTKLKVSLVWMLNFNKKKGGGK